MSFFVWRATGMLNLPVLLKHVPSKVSILRGWLKSWPLSQIYSSWLPFSTKGKGCNFKPLVKELQIFGERGKLLLIDCLGCVFSVLEVLLVLRHKADQVSGVCQIIRLHHAVWEGAAGEWAGGKGKCGVSRHSSRKRPYSFFWLLHVAKNLNIFNCRLARTVPPPKVPSKVEEKTSVFQTTSKELLYYLNSWLSVL